MSDCRTGLDASENRWKHFVSLCFVLFGTVWWELLGGLPPGAGGVPRWKLSGHFGHRHLIARKLGRSGGPPETSKVGLQRSFRTQLDKKELVTESQLPQIAESFRCFSFHRSLVPLGCIACLPSLVRNPGPGWL